LWMDSLVIHYPTTSVLLIDSSTGATSSDFLYLVNSTDNTGRFSPAGDLSQGILLANLVEGSYSLSLVAVDNAGHSDTAKATIQVYGPPKCPPQRTVASIQTTVFGQVITIPLTATKIYFSDGTTQP